MTQDNRLYRLLDKENKPSREDILKFIGKQASESWLKLEQIIRDHYDFERETVFYGQKYGWTVRYRRSGKTFCSLFPEKGSFTVLITLGRKETERAIEVHDELSIEVNELIEKTDQLHDGRWLWVNVTNTDLIPDIMKLLQIKRKPNRK
jgi:hypothetical protein